MWCINNAVENGRVVMRIIKVISWSMFLSLAFWGVLFFIEKTNFSAESPTLTEQSTRKKFIQRQRKHLQKLMKNALAQIKTLQEQATKKPFLATPPHELLPPDVQKLLDELNVTTAAEAIKKIKGLDNLLAEFAAENTKQALKNFENGITKIEKTLETIAAAVDLDIEFVENNPISIANKILENIYLLKSIYTIY